MSGDQQRVRRILRRLPAVSEHAHDLQRQLNRPNEELQRLEERLSSAKSRQSSLEPDKDSSKETRARWRKRGPVINARVQSLRHDVQSARFQDRLTRRNILQRMRSSERRYNDLYRRLTRIDKTIGVGNLYKANVPRKRVGVDVRVEISLDGKYFSNPAPRVPGGETIWVRAVITNLMDDESGVMDFPEFAHVTWKIGKGYQKTDLIRKNGHDVFFVSNPLVLTRKFIAPDENTNQNFLVIVRTFERLEP